MKTLETINWGIIGVGDVTEVKSGPAFHKTEHSNVVVVMRRDAEKAADYASRHGIPKWYSDATDLIDELRGVGSCVSTGESAARTNRVLEEMVSNYYQQSGVQKPYI